MAYKKRCKYKNIIHYNMGRNDVTICWLCGDASENPMINREDKLISRLVHSVKPTNIT